MPEGPLGFPRLTDIGPLVESEEDKGILIVDTQFELSVGDGYLYHIAERDDIPSIIENGIIGSKKPFEERERGEGPGVEAQRMLNRALNEGQNVMDSGAPRLDASDLPRREDAVFLFGRRNKAVERAGGLEEPIIISVEADEIPCNNLELEKPGCVVADLETADELFEMFFNQAKEQAPVDKEREEKLVKRYWNTARFYLGGNVGSRKEIFCSCDIPPEAIEEITKEVAMLDGDTSEVF